MRIFCVCLLCLIGCGKSSTLKFIDYDHQKKDAEQIAKDELLKLAPDLTFLETPWDGKDKPASIFQAKTIPGGFMVLRCFCGTREKPIDCGIILRNDMVVMQARIGDKDYKSDETLKMDRAILAHQR